MSNMSTGHINTILNNLQNGQPVIVQVGALKYLLSTLKTSQGSEAVLPYYQPMQAPGPIPDLTNLKGF